MYQNSSESPLLSVIIPAFNLEAYITDCVESIERQSYKRIEIIIVDDGSTDNTHVICMELAQKYSNIRFLKQQHSGVSAARSKGVRAAEGTYVVFIDGDDYIEPDMFDKMMKYAVTYDMVSCGVYRHFSDERIEIVSDQYDQMFNAQEMSKLFSNMIYDFSSKCVQPLTPWMFNKIFHKDMTIRIFENMPAKITYAEDSVFLYQYILQADSVMFISEPLYHYRYRGDSVWHSKNEHMLENINMVYLILKDVFTHSSDREILMRQLQKWTVVLTMNAVNRYMGFSNEFAVSQYRIDERDLKEKKVILYGAGQVGQCLYRQLTKEGIEIVSWADQDASHYRLQGYDVNLPEDIKDISYDIVLIAARQEILFHNIKDFLLEMGIESKKIIWKKPIEIF